MSPVRGNALAELFEDLVVADRPADHDRPILAPNGFLVKTNDRMNCAQRRRQSPAQSAPTPSRRLFEPRTAPHRAAVICFSTSTPRTADSLLRGTFNQRSALLDDPCNSARGEFGLPSSRGGKDLRGRSVRSARSDWRRIIATRLPRVAPIRDRGSHLRPGQVLETTVWGSLRRDSFFPSAHNNSPPPPGKAVRFKPGKDLRPV